MSSPTVEDLTARIAAIWAEVLGVADIRPEDNFFRLGGNSLMAAEAVAAMTEQSISIELLDFFRAESLAKLIEYASKARPDQVNNRHAR